MGECDRVIFVDDWNVRIKYVNWSGNKTALIKLEDRNNREYFEKWPIRKPIFTNNVRPRKRRSVTTNSQNTCKERHTVDNQFCFVGRSFKKASDLPEICKRVDEPHSGSEVHFATVRSVDPFLECYEVDICLAGKTFIRYFDYEQLRPSNYTIDNDLSGGESSSNDVFVNGTPRVKQAGQRQSKIPSKPKLVPKKNKKKGMFNYFCFKFLAKIFMTQNWVKICKKYMTYLRNDPKTSISVYL